MPDSKKGQEQIEGLEKGAEVSWNWGGGQPCSSFRSHIVLAVKGADLIPVQLVR